MTKWVKLLIRSYRTKKTAAEAKRYFVQVQVYENVCILKKLDQMLHLGQDGYWVDIKKYAATLSKVHYLPSTGHIPGSDHQSTEILQYTSHRHSQTIIGKVHTHPVFEIIRK